MGGIGTPASPPHPPATWGPADGLWVLRLLARHWAVLLLSGLAGMLALMAFMIITGPRYDVSAKIVVQLGRETAAPPVLSGRPSTPVMPAALRPEDIASEVELLRNPALIRRVVDELGEDFFLAEPPVTTLFQHIKQVPKQAWRGLRAGVDALLAVTGLRPPITPLERVTVAIGAGMTVENIRKSDVIEVKLAFPDPQAGTLFLDRYLGAALDSHVQANRQSSALAFFTSERDARDAELRDAERRLLAGRADPAATWSSPEQRSAILKAEAELDLQVTQVAADVAQSEAEIVRNEAMLTALAPEATLSTVRARNKAVDDLSARIAQLEVDLGALRSRYAEGSPDLADMRRQIAALTAEREREPESQVQQVTVGANQRYEALARDVSARASQLAGQRARAATLSASLAQMRRRIQIAEAGEIGIKQLERDVSRLRRDVDQAEAALDDARLADAMGIPALANLRVLMPATADLVPSAPRISRTLIAGFAAGLLAALGAVVLRAYAATAGVRAPLRRALTDAGTAPAMRAAPDAPG